MTKEERLRYCLEFITSIKNSEGELQSQRAEAMRYYFADSIGGEVEGRSKIVTSDLSDTVEWIMPSLMRIFCGGDEICTITPRGPEDQPAAESANELINYQLRIRNKWFLAIHDSFKDALLQKIGVIKYSWHTEKTKFDKYYEGITMDEVMSIMLSDPETEISEQKQNEDGTYDVTITRTLKDAYPLIEAVPPHEVGFPKDTRDLDECPLFFHRTKLYPYQLIKLYGKGAYAKVKDLVDNHINPLDGAEDVDFERFADIGGADFFYSKEDRRIWVYECYFRDPDTGEHRKMTLCGDIVLEDMRNKYGAVPFVVITPIKLTHRIIGRSMHDLIKDLQRLRTALTRQMLDNIYFTNNGRWIGDETRVNTDDLLNNNVPGGFVRGDPTAISPLGPQQLNPLVFKYMEFVFNEKENRTGITRYSQGLDSNSLNKTARGISAILQQSQQRMELMARLFAELGIAPLVQAVLDMDIKFMQSPQMIRVRENFVEINPDNLVGRWDVIINVGIGTGNRDQIIAQMQQLLGIYGQLSQAGMAGQIFNPTNIYNACKELTKAMGYRNTDDFWSKPMAEGGMVPEGMTPPMEGQGGPEQMAIAQLMSGGTPPGGNQVEQPSQPMQPGTTPEGQIS